MRDAMRVAEQMAKDGADRIGIADTVGYASPGAVKELFSELCNTVGQHITIGAHFHNTRGLGLANVFAALEAGVREFDGALGGLGGCPHAPSATGNIVTEDLVFLLESEGLRTGIDLEKLLEVRRFMETVIGGEPTHGSYINAGPPKGWASA
jgi:hydroxymethylglutaryl-CoA lyase